MSRTATVEIARSEGHVVFRLFESGAATGDMHDFTRLDIDVGGLPSMSSFEGVRDYGKRLTQALNCHEAVKRELDYFFGGVDPDPASLHFSISTTDGERYRWETLYTDPNFLAVMGQCSLKRIVPSGLYGIPAPRSFHGPVRMAAFLSPAGVSSTAEFDAIADAVVEARQRNHDIELAVFVGEQSLLDEILESIKRNRLSGITARPMPGSTIALEKVLKDEPVQLLHFFCHGQLQQGIRFLRFATISDHEAGEKEGSVDLSIDRLREIQSLSGTVWLTVLNSCSGAQEVPGLYSMAATLSRSASPVTIGMAEQINSNDATLFAASFYPTALRTIGEATTALKNQQQCSIDLGPAIGAARRALYKAAQDDIGLNGPQDGFRRWCLPVLYQRAAGLSVIRSHDPATMERLETVAKLLRGMASDTPTGLREQILEVLAHPTAIPRELWPDLFGNFKL
jgi:hypothetical protein